MPMSKRELLISLFRENTQQEDSPPLSRRESEELGKLARQKAKVKKKDGEAREAALIADAERCLAKEFSSQDVRWRDFIQKTKVQIEEFNRQLVD
jgi:hypothetical protein